MNKIEISKLINKRLHELSTYDPFITPTEAGDYQYFTYRPKNSELPIIFRRKTPSDKNDKNSGVILPDFSTNILFI